MTILQRGFAACAIAAIATLCACGGGSARGPLPVAVSSPSPAAYSGSTGNAKFTFAITAPAASTNAKKRSPAYLPATTASISIQVVDINGSAVSLPAVVTNVAPGSGTCTGVTNGDYTCTISLGMPSYTDTTSIVAYDGANATGKVLSAYAGSFTVVPGQTTTFGTAVAPVHLVAQVGSATTCTSASNVGLSIELTATAYASGTQCAGAGVPGSFAVGRLYPAQFSVALYDADGNLIPANGPGAPTLTLSGLNVKQASYSVNGSTYLVNLYPTVGAETFGQLFITANTPDAYSTAAASRSFTVPFTYLPALIAVGGCGVSGACSVTSYSVVGDTAEQYGYLMNNASFGSGTTATFEPDMLAFDASNRLYAFDASAATTPIAGGVEEFSAASVHTCGALTSCTGPAPTVTISGAAPYTTSFDVAPNGTVAIGGYASGSTANLAVYPPGSNTISLIYEANPPGSAATSVAIMTCTSTVSGCPASGIWGYAAAISESPSLSGSGFPFEYLVTVIPGSGPNACIGPSGTIACTVTQFGTGVAADASSYGVDIVWDQADQALIASNDSPSTGNENLVQFNWNGTSFSNASSPLVITPPNHGGAVSANRWGHPQLAVSPSGEVIAAYPDSAGTADAVSIWQPGTSNRTLSGAWVGTTAYIETPAPTPSPSPSASPTATPPPTPIPAPFTHGVGSVGFYGVSGPTYLPVLTQAGSTVNQLCLYASISVVSAPTCTTVPGSVVLNGFAVTGQSTHRSIRQLRGMLRGVRGVGR